jgi:hypothetical protein
MDNAARDTLVRRRRLVLLVAAAVVAVPVAFAVRKSNDWTVFAAALVLLVVVGLLGTVTASGPWAKEGDDWQPKPTDDPFGGSHMGRHSDEGEQLVLSPRASRTRVHARR